MLGKNITLRSVDPLDPAVVEATILDGSQPVDPNQASVVTFTGTEQSDCVLDGLTITGGKGTRPQGAQALYGGGIYGAGTLATLRRCRVINNSLAEAQNYWDAIGAGVFDADGVIDTCDISANIGSPTQSDVLVKGAGIAYCDGLILDSVISDNLADSYFAKGAGAYMCNADFHGCTISRNFTRNWGGGCAYCSGTLDTCTIAENVAYEGGAGLWYHSGIIRNSVFRSNTGWGGGTCYACSGSIVDTLFEGNRSIYGMLEFQGQVERCTFRDNMTDSYGGALTLTGPTSVTECTFEGNQSWDGGAINIVSGLATIQNSQFKNNEATIGGAIYSSSGSFSVNQCYFEQNLSELGGAIYSGTGTVSIEGTLFVGNTACRLSGCDNGGAILGGADLKVTGCVFSGNQAGNGGAVSVAGDERTHITGNTFSGNSTIGGLGGGILFTGSAANLAQVSNSVFWMNRDGPGGQGTGQVVSTGGVPIVQYSLVEGGWTGPGTGNIDTDPLFIDADGADDIPGTIDDDLRLSANSPCIDAGANSAVPPEITVDLAGNPRFLDAPLVPDTGIGTPPVVDMGAYEFFPDCNENGVLDATDIQSGTSQDCDANGNPDECDADSDGDGVIDGCDPCPVDNPDDTDGDTVCDSLDACLGFDDLADGDGDGTPDGCDPCPADNPNDSDGDTVCDSADICAGFDDRIDTDSDGTPDGCDVCPMDNPNDTDGDGVCDSDDVCPGLDDALDADGDGNPDGCDPCPLDNPDDSDGDSVCDSVDVCPGFDDGLDADSDGVPDGCDPCPLDNPDDTDGDGACDSVDPCPLDNPDDSDGDGVCESADVCPGFDDNIDADGDGTPDGCDPCPLDNPNDSDGDGVCNSADICPGFDDAIDGDGDGQPDGCDPCPADNPDDSDGDTVCESADLCPGLDDRIDPDADGQPTGCDNCPLMPNAGQSDFDGNGVGDACELPLAVPGDVTKNRYVSFTPNSAATPVAFAVVHWESGATLYVGEPLTQPASIVGLGICRLVADPVFRDWSDTPIVHVAGCMIATNELYEVHTTADGINLSQPLLRITTPRPVDGRWWGDVVGGFTGPGGTPPNTWTAPDGFVNGLDIIAMVRSFESSESAPELVRVDVNPEVPDQAVNGNDILRVVNAFSIGSGREYYPYRVPMGTGPQGQSQCTLPE